MLIFSWETGEIIWYLGIRTCRKMIYPTSFVKLKMNDTERTDQYLTDVQNIHTLGTAVIMHPMDSVPYS
jgi:hypothetical protein